MRQSLEPRVDIGGAKDLAALLQLIICTLCLIDEAAHLLFMSRVPFHGTHT